MKKRKPRPRLNSNSSATPTAPAPAMLRTPRRINENKREARSEQFVVDRLRRKYDYDATETDEPPLDALQIEP